MKTLKLGRSGIDIPDLCLGTMTFPTHTSEADAHRQIDMCIEAKVNFLDAAEMYPVNPVRAETVGQTEECIGRWIEATGRRSDVIIATKASGDMPLIRGGEGFGPGNILDILEASLRRLGTDYIDLYQLHWPMRGSFMFRQNWTYDPRGWSRDQVMDHMTGVLEKLAEAQKAGKIRAFGLSNESAWGTTKWIDIAEEIGAPRVASVQNEYSLMCRMFDTDMAEMAVQEDVVLLSFSPLAGGILSGKYQNGARPQGSRAALDPSGNMGGRLLGTGVEAAVAAYLSLAEKYGVDPLHMALAWQRSRPFPISAIFGATTVGQLEHILAARDMVLSGDLIAEIDEVHKAHPMPY